MIGALFLFGKDLRLTDNYGLCDAAQQTHQVIPLYVHDNAFLPPNMFSSSWLRRSLEQLTEGLERVGSGLIVSSGDAIEIIINLCLEFRCCGI